MSNLKLHVFDAVDLGGNGELTAHEALSDLTELDNVLGLIIDCFYESHDIEEALQGTKDNLRKAISLIRQTFNGVVL